MNSIYLFQIIPDSDDMIQHLLNNNKQHDLKIKSFFLHTPGGAFNQVTAP